MLAPTDARRIGTYTETLSVPGAPPGIEWEYTYDDAARVVGAERREGQQTTTWSYDYDANGNRLVETIDGVTVTAQYDSRDRLVSTSQGATVFTYVLNGNLESRATGALATTYDYDPFGRLRGVSLPDGDLVSYDLDVAGRRVAKRLNGAVVKQWAYRDFLRPVAELDGATVTALFVYTPEHHAPSSMVKGGVSYRILTNAQGSVRLVVNAATGQVAQELEYDPFGRVIKDTNPGFQPFAFAGGLYDPDTGLVHFGHREYDADTGRWTTIDPIQLAGGDTNYYAYVANDPVNRIDLNGLRAISDWVMPPYDGTDWQDEARSDLADVTFDVLLSFVPMPPVLKAFKWAQEWHKARKAEKIAKATAGAAEQAAKCIGKVIGRTKDLLKPGALRAGEEGLIVRVGKTYKDTWKSNSGALRKAMKSGQPIRDASVGKKGPFLDAERALLKDKGWLFDGTFWRP